MESACPLSSVVGQPVAGGSHEPGDGTGKEILVAHADVARQGCVPLPEGLGHALQLGAHLDESVQLYARPPASHTEASHQCLSELGTQVVAHLGKGCGP